MPATTNYQAGYESTDAVISYGVEATWGTKPATAFQAIRFISETLSGSKQRDRPGEITGVHEVAAATTTQEMAQGDVNFALSYGTFDDLFSGALNNDWQPPVALAGAAGDVTITNNAGVVTLSSTTANKFSALSAGQWIRLLGFANAGNNGFWRVAAKASATSLTLAGPNTAVTETPAGAAAQLRASTLVNGNAFKSFFLQKAFSPTAYLQYPGSYVSKLSLQGGVKQFLQGSVSFMSQAEQQATVNGSTGAVLAAPGGRVHDPVGGFGPILLNEAALPGVVDSFNITAQMQGAAGEYGMGSAAAQGIVSGQLQVTGSLKVYFKDFSLYQRFKSESLGALEFITRDPAGNAYVVTVLNAALMNPKIQVGGPNQPVYASFDIEANPLSGGGTLQIDRLPAA